MGRQDYQPDDWGCQRGGGTFALILVDNETVPSLLYVVLCNCKTGYGYIQNMHPQTQLYLMMCVTLTGIGRGHGQNKRYVKLIGKMYVQICEVV